MNETQRSVYLEARRYWDTRFNDIHVPIAYADARELLLAHPQADPEIVVPAILLHDVGWKAIPEDQQARAFGPRMEDSTLRRLHETEGARVAGEIMARLGFDRDHSSAVIAIVDGHDTRPKALSLEDALVKDADRLWRFSAAGIALDHRRFQIPADKHLARLGEGVGRWLFTDRAKEMANERLARALRGLEEGGAF